MARIWHFTFGVLLWGLCAWITAAPLSANSVINGITDANVELPPKFIARTLVSGLTLPTDMAILPSGDFLVIEKGLGAATASSADVRLVRGGVLQPNPVLTLGVNSLEDSGLLGIVLDPLFAANGHFYVWYSTGEGSLGWDGTSSNRLSRFTFNSETSKASLNSETIVLDKVPWAPIHNGGGLIFDDQGNLLITTGDAGGNLLAPQHNPAQSPFSLNGKVLRIRPLPGGGYEIPVDNPYAGNVEGIRQEIYAMGLRNPFRIAQRAATRQFYLVDVGHDSWEEINLLVPGANYGWPYREGKCDFSLMTDCTPTPAGYTDPVVDYRHPENLGAGFTGLAFYEGTQWPPLYQGGLFVADLNSNWLGMTIVDQINPAFATFASAIDAVVDIETSAEGLYALSIVNGSIISIYYDDESNHPPTAQWVVSPIEGVAPLGVIFQAIAQDIDNDDLVYLWDFGDGQSVTTVESSISHVYELDGDYLATLQVIDEDDGRSEILSELVQVYSGAPPIIVQQNLTQDGRTLYHGGDEFRFTADRVRENDDDLHPIEPYAWTVLLHHNEHQHYLLAEYISEEVLLTMPTKMHALGVPLWYEVQVTMQTAQGQKIRRSLELRPQTTTLQVQSWPGPSNITIDHQVQDPDTLITVIVGQEYTLEAPKTIIHNRLVGEFTNWVVTPSWPLASAEDETVILMDRVIDLVATAEAHTYIAYYEYTRPALVLHMPTVRR